jgi:hypothetical protein
VSELAPLLGLIRQRSPAVRGSGASEVFSATFS